MGLDWKGRELEGAKLRRSVAPVPRGSGRRLPGAAPYGPFRARAGFRAEGSGLAGGAGLN